MKKNKILLSTDREPVQENLFAPPSVKHVERPFPPVYRDLDNFRRILWKTAGKLGVDFEFPPSYKADVVGIATATEAASVFATPELVAELVDVSRRCNRKLIGHSVLGAEIEVVKATTGIQMGVDEWDDTMLKHFLVNQDFAKAPDKGEDDGAMGFMNLWTAVSMVLDVPNWKQCQGKGCYGDLCPRHDVRGYCALDSWGSVAIDEPLDTQMASWGVPQKFYSELKELTGIAEKMTRQGLKVDMAWVDELEAKAEEYKEKLFPYEQHGKEKVYSQFNPRSSDQVISWFAARGVVLPDVQKPTIIKVLTKLGEKYGFAMKDGQKFSVAALAAAADLPEALDALYREYEYKSAGKGLAPWFDPKYRDSSDFIHPRFITIGASTGRWSSSRPNFQNIPARGFGALVRAAVVPRSSDLDLLKADFSQLELRMCLYLSGVDPNIIGKDAFTWLVENSEGLFNRAAELYGGKPRDIAKSVSHAGDYLEGFQVLSFADLARPNIKKEIEHGARRVYLKRFQPSLKHDWLYRGGVVTFTGANLAERLFGDKSHENRKKALAIQEDVYFARFPMLRDWHWRVLDFIQNHNFVKSPTGRFLRLYGSPEDDAKMATAFLGQGVSADHVTGVLLRMHRELGILPILMVHDELVQEIPREWDDKRAYEQVAIMAEETDRLPGFKGAFKAIRGQCWLEGQEDTPTKKGTPDNLKEKALWPLKLAA